NLLISWNCRSARNKITDIRDIITHYNPVCFALQETHLSPTDDFRLRGYICYRKDNKDGNRFNGGVAILVSTALPSVHLPLS
ncbi:endonuclease/exonuclease/phosphatase family protein, partial [Vibrio vulnificus]|uniref:endonuclease/exonuclease/phosphatase family protein n=1 Tax=Vibrio vulnificus TaxID=672 RepID=UPI0019D4D4A3